VVFTFGMESAYLRYAENRKEAANVFKTLQLGLLGFCVTALRDFMADYAVAPAAC
jgi:hypothetical protein